MRPRNSRKALELPVVPVTNVSGIRFRTRMTQWRDVGEPRARDGVVVGLDERL